MIFYRENNKEVRKINSFGNNYGIGIDYISDHCNVLDNSNIRHINYFKTSEHVDKINLLLIFLMFR